MAKNTEDTTDGTLQNTSDTESEYVVLKGNRIHHNGEIFRETQIIPVSGSDADRLIKAGVIADTAVLRERFLASVPGVSVESE